MSCTIISARLPSRRLARAASSVIVAGDARGKLRRRRSSSPATPAASGQASGKG
jgi:hypothetical protein